MKATLRKASDYNFVKEIEVNSIDDLCKIMDEYNSALILGRPIGNTIDIEIYDNYVE